MATLKELRDEHLRKLSELKALGINPYPSTAQRTHVTQEITEQFDQLEGTQVTVTGRIVSIRKFGKIAFVVVRDASGSLQLFLRTGNVVTLNSVENTIGMEQLPLLDTGDFLQATGQVIRTKTGEISIDVETMQLLSKTLRTMPSSQEGFTNKEERMRRRYIDMNVNRDVYERYIRRSKFWQSTREFLLQNGFLEINVPVLEAKAGGADANPFVTHMDALDEDFYLRISHELPLKRLLGGGYEKVFDIGPRFRNENYSDEHLPEHVAMEWYAAYKDWRWGMEFTTEMVRHIAQNTWGTLQFTLANGQSVDLSQDFKEIDYVQVIQDRYDINPLDCTLEQVKKALADNKLEVEKSENISRGIDKLWKKIRVELAGPAYLVNIPTFLQPLAKIQPERPELSEQFNLILGGTEASKAYSELNDPLDQLGRFVQQQKMRDAGDDEAMMLDIDFVEMLEYGMPPACGYGHSERLFWMLEGVTAREGVPFPHLRHEIDEITKAIYPEVNF